MFVLALDTAVQRASVVLAEDDRELAAWQADARHDLCRRLAAEIAATISRTGRRWTDLDLVSVGLGPGSFTSLRIGLATAKAISLAHDLPLVGISSLAAMAWQARDRAEGLLCPMLDAGRGEIYAALYRTCTDGLEQVEPEFAADPAALAARVRSIEEPTCFFGQLDRLPLEDIEAALADRGTLLRDTVVRPDALAVAQLGLRRLSAVGGDDAPSLHPIYVRKSYAEERFDIDLGLR